MKLWDVPNCELDAPTPLRVRDLIVECFFRAQRETFQRSAEKLGKQPQDGELRKAVLHAVRSSVREVGGDWDAPTVEVLRLAIARLGERAAAWGTPEDIVRHHGAQIGRLLEACAAAH